MLAVACRPLPGAPGSRATVLLLGDSTTIGSVCREVAPEGPHLEALIAKRLSEHERLPGIQVVNLGRDDESIDALFRSGRYDREVATREGADYVVVRYGIIDSVRREQFVENFPRDYRTLIDRLRTDFPGVTVLLSTIVPFRAAEADAEVNRLIASVAAATQLPLVDVYGPFAEMVRRDAHGFTYRRIPLMHVPVEHHRLVAPFVHGDHVVVLDGALDDAMAAVPGWFAERHPNLRGYEVIAEATATRLAMVMRARSS